MYPPRISPPFAHSPGVKQPDRNRRASSPIDASLGSTGLKPVQRNDQAAIGPFRRQTTRFAPHPVTPNPSPPLPVPTRHSPSTPSDPISIPKPRQRARSAQPARQPRYIRASNPRRVQCRRREPTIAHTPASLPLLVPSRIMTIYFRNTVAAQLAVRILARERSLYA